MPIFVTRLPLFSSGLRAGLLMALCVGLLSSFGCANGEIRMGDPFDRELTLEEAQHRYTVLVRWSDFQRSKGFVAKDEREAYTEAMEQLEDARFTDYESDSIELDDEKQTATIKVVYTLYLPSLPYEMEIVETQEWSRNGITNDWNVMSNFESLTDVASN